MKHIKKYAATEYSAKLENGNIVMVHPRENGSLIWTFINNEETKTIETTLGVTKDCAIAMYKMLGAILDLEDTQP